MEETPEQTTERLRRDGYRAHCDEHGNQIFPWDPKTQWHWCPVGECPARLSDFRTDEKRAACTAVFWNCGLWKAVVEEAQQ